MITDNRKSPSAITGIRVTEHTKEQLRLATTALGLAQGKTHITDEDRLITAYQFINWFTANNPQMLKSISLTTQSQPQ